jgi:hypothetical protein
VEDVAELVHKDLARSLKYARIWARADSTDRTWARSHPVADGDVIELHV